MQPHTSPKQPNEFEDVSTCSHVRTSKCVFECMKAHPAALAGDHRFLIQLLSMFENGIGCSVCRAMVAGVCVCADVWQQTERLLWVYAGVVGAGIRLVGTGGQRPPRLATATW